MRRRNEDITKTYGYTNGGEDEALTDAQNQERYLKAKRSGRITIQTKIPLAVLSVEKNPGTFQTVQPGARMALPDASRRTQPHRRMHHSTYAWASPFACTNACGEYSRRAD